MSALLLALQTVLWSTMLFWPSPKVVLPSSNIPKVWGVRHARQFPWDGSSDSILKWFHLYYFSQWKTLLLRFWSDQNHSLWPAWMESVGWRAWTGHHRVPIEYFYSNSVFCESLWCIFCNLNGFFLFCFKLPNGSESVECSRKSGIKPSIGCIHKYRLNQTPPLEMIFQSLSSK